MGWLIFGLLLCLLCTVGMTTHETSGWDDEVINFQFY